MKLRRVVLVACVLVVWALSTAAAQEVDPTGKFAIGLQARGGLQLASKGSIESYPEFDVAFSHPLGFSTFIGRYYASPGMDFEIGLNLYSWSMKDGSSKLSLTDIPLSFGLFTRTSLGDAAHIRAGGRFNLDLLSASVEYGGRSESDTEFTLSLEAALGVEWFISKHFSLTPEAQFCVEFPNEATNGDATTIATGFQFTLAVIP